MVVVGGVGVCICVYVCMYVCRLPKYSIKYIPYICKFASQLFKDLTHISYQV